MKMYDEITKEQQEFIQKQKMFFVATAPISGEGHVNLSPKGYDSFSIIDENTVAFADLGGSGAETIAHLKENGRVTIMFNSYDSKPLILRLYGKGEAIIYGEDGFNELEMKLPKQECAIRSIIKIHVTKTQESCGWGVPLYDFKEERKVLKKYISKYTQEEWIERRKERNQNSIDGLAALKK